MNLKNFLKGSIIGGIFLVPFIPFIVSSSMFFPFITGKNFTFRIIVEIIFALWLILQLYAPEYRMKRSWILISMAAFVGVMTIADLFGVNFFRSFWSNFERMEGLITLFHLLAYIVVVSSVLNTEKLWNRWFNTSIGVSVLIALYGFGQIAGLYTIHQGGLRLDATFGNASYLAVYLLFHIFITAWFFYKSLGKLYPMMLYGAALCMQVIILMYTGTRGTVLGVVGGIMLSALLIALFGKEYPGLRKTALSGLGVLVLLVGAFIGLRNVPAVQENPILARFANVSLSDTTVESRFILWRNIAWNGFKERPILGWGQDNFIHVFGKYYKAEMYKQEPWFDRAHNVFFDWLIAGGILGLLSYLLLFVSALLCVWKSTFTLPERAFLTGLFAAYFFHNIFVFDTLISYVYFATVLAYIHHKSVAAPLVVKTKKPAPVLPATTRRLLSSGIVIAGLGLIYFLNVPGISTAKTLIKALSSQNNPAVSQELFSKAVANRSVGLEEAREQFGITAIRVAHGGAPETVKQAFVQKAGRELVAQTKADPQNTRPLFFLGVFLNGIGNYEDALIAYEKALDINNTRQIILFEKGTVLSSLGRAKEAFDLYEYVYELTPEYQEAQMRYALSAHAIGETAVVETQIRVLQDRIAKDAMDAQAHFSLGILYLNTGKREEAIMEFRKAIVLNPDFRAEGEAIIKAIQEGKAVRVLGSR